MNEETRRLVDEGYAMLTDGAFALMVILLFSAFAMMLLPWRLLWSLRTLRRRLRREAR